MIERLEGQTRSVEGVWLGIGDDAAVLEPGRFDLITVDTLVEGVHFRRDWSTPEEIGWKLLASNLSDIAAMGGAPGPCLLAATLSPAVDGSWVERLLEGARAAIRAMVPEGFEVGLIGGDTTQTAGAVVLSLTLLGESPPSGAILRSGATPGDRLCLIGALGESAAGLRALEIYGGQEGALPSSLRRLVEVHKAPTAQVKAGALLGLHGLANALLDVSDGLAQDLGHMARRSQVGARVSASRIPASAELRAASETLGESLWTWLLAGGEDYALLASVSPDRGAALWALAEEHGLAVADIGEVREAKEGVRFLDASGADIPLARKGWQHRFGAAVEQA